MFDKIIMLMLYTWEQGILEISAPYLRHYITLFLFFSSSSFNEQDMRTCIIFSTRARYDDISSSSSLGYQVVQKRFVKRVFEQCGVAVWYQPKRVLWKSMWCKQAPTFEVRSILAC